MLKTFVAYSLSATIKNPNRATNRPVQEPGLRPRSHPCRRASLDGRRSAQKCVPEKFLLTVNTEGIIPH